MHLYLPPYFSGLIYLVVTYLVALFAPTPAHMCACSFALCYLGLIIVFGLFVCLPRYTLDLHFRTHSEYISAFYLLIIL